MVSNSAANRGKDSGGKVESTAHIAIIPPPFTPQRTAARNPMPEAPTAAMPTETIEVDDRTVACDGGVGALGHPRVFLYIEQRSVVCPYCSRLYVLKEGVGQSGGH
jgi:uncharacterized Zn-finger protein